MTTAPSPAPFLSPAWIDAVTAVRAGMPTPEGLPAAVVNFVVDGAPDDLAGDGTINASLDTTSGEAELVLGHHEAPDVIVTADYATAQSLLIDVDPAAAMNAFLTGTVVIQGELIKLMTLFGVLAADPNAAAAAEAVRALTA